MELTQKIIIYVAFIGIGLVAAILRMWFVGYRYDSFKKEFKYNLIALVAFAVIATIIIYLNN